MLDLTRTRLLVLIGATEGVPGAVPAGAEPLEGVRALPGADVLLLVAGAGEPDAMLFRYTAHGDAGGATWHPTATAARADAAAEYGAALLLPWEPVPDDIADAHDYAVRYAADRLNSRGKW